MTADGRVIALDGKVTLDENAAFRHPRRTHALEDIAATDPLEAAGEGAEPQLRQARRRGRDHRQRRGSGDVDPGRRRVRRRGVRRGAGRRTSSTSVAAPSRRGDGQRSRRHPFATRRCRSVFVNVFGGITSCDAVANGIVQALAMLEARRAVDQAARRPPRRQQRRGGPPHPAPRPRIRWSNWSTRWTAPPAGRRTRRERRLRSGPDGDLAHRGPRSSSRASPARGHQAHPPDGGVRDATWSAVSTPARPAREVDGIPVFATVAEAMETTGADVSVVFVPPAFASDAVARGDRRRRCRCSCVITEGMPVQDSADFYAYAREARSEPGSSGRTAPA